MIQIIEFLTKQHDLILGVARIRHEQKNGLKSEHAKQNRIECRESSDRQGKIMKDTRRPKKTGDISRCNHKSVSAYFLFGHVHFLTGL